MSAAKASEFRRTFVQIWVPQHRCPPNLFGKALTQLFAFRGTRQCGISAITQIFAIMAVLQVKCVQCLFSASSYKPHALGIKLRLSTCDHQPCTRLCSSNLARPNVETAKVTRQTPRCFIAQCVAQSLLKRDRGNFWHARFPSRSTSCRSFRSMSSAVIAAL